MLTMFTAREKHKHFLDICMSSMTHDEREVFFSLAFDSLCANQRSSLLRDRRSITQLSYCTVRLLPILPARRFDTACRTRKLRTVYSTKHERCASAAFEKYASCAVCTCIAGDTSLATGESRCTTASTLGLLLKQTARADTKTVHMRQQTKQGSSSTFWRALAKEGLSFTNKPKMSLSSIKHEHRHQTRSTGSLDARGREGTASCSSQSVQYWQHGHYNSGCSKKPLRSPFGS